MKRVVRAALLGLVGGLLFPAASTTLVQKREWTWPAPEFFQLGELVVLPHQNEWREVRLNGRRMTHLSTSSVWIGAAPRGQVALTAWLTSSGKSKMDVAEKIIPVRSLLLENATNLNLPKKTWKRMSDPNAQARVRDRKILGEILSNYSGKFEPGCWQSPLASRVTSKFGSPRRLPDGQTYFHSGEDRRAIVGTPVKAAGKGVVVFSGDMMLPGTNVIVKHGEGWFSRFLHFSKSSVKAGDVVEAGYEIGLSGASGRVEAPHLHWEIVWKGIPVDPDHFLRGWARLCDPK